MHASFSNFGRWRVRICWHHALLARLVFALLIVATWQRRAFPVCSAASIAPVTNGKTVPDLSDIRYQVALANRMLANEGVLDAFGHVSLRHPADPGRYLLSRSRSPGLIEPDDILEFTLDSEPVAPPSVPLYAERVIHGCIYQARPDVMAVCHHHAPAVMPFCIAGLPIVAVFQLGAAAGEKVPFWNQRDEFGDTNLLVVKPEEGRSLARALGQQHAVLMNHHGAMPNVTNRTWEYWTLRLARAGGLPRAARSKARLQAASGRRRTSTRTPARGQKMRKSRRTR
jgi:ribulose-5-phosphate 4-epimerase/fuculose-1-phosphate aldolase